MEARESMVAPVRCKRRHWDAPEFSPSYYQYGMNAASHQASLTDVERSGRDLPQRLTIRSTTRIDSWELNEPSRKKKGDKDNPVVVVVVRFTLEKLLRPLRTDWSPNNALARKLVVGLALLEQELGANRDIHENAASQRRKDFEDQMLGLMRMDECMHSL